MTLRTLAAFLAAFSVCGAHAAAKVLNVTPAATSIETTQPQVLSVQTRDATNNPSVGEVVTFTADGCGTFSNGLQQMAVTSVANGIASVTFTAGIETGLTCIVRAAAGATAQIIVITYRLDQVAIFMDTFAAPNPPLPGRAFTIEGYVRIGSIELPNVDFTVQIINGTGKADISSPGGNTAALTRLQLNVFPQDIVGDFEIEFTFKTLKRRFPVSPGAIAGLYQDMWWAGNAENGWGISILQHSDTIFAVLFVYGDDGKPTWYVLPSGTWNAAHTVYTGDVYLPKGSPFFAYDASRFQPGTPVGTVMLTFNDASNGFLDYTIGSKSGTKQISRQPFGAVLANGRTNHGDMYWGGTSQNGWGVAVLQQYDGFFVVWFTYDANGLPTWFVMPAGTYATSTSYEGRLYRTTGSAWVGATYRAAQLGVFDAGPFRLRLNADGVPTALDYTVDGRTGTLSLSRQGF